MCEIDRNQKRIQELLKKPGNNRCADCGNEDVKYGSFNLGAFLCTTCACVHLKIGIHVSKVKSLTLARWNDDQIEAMENLGNEEVNRKYEKHIPAYYRKPTPDCPSILLEQFIRAKYERMEFIHVDKQKYNNRSMSDTLRVKKNRDSAYVPRWFVLTDGDWNLHIFSDKTAKTLKWKIPLSELNISLASMRLIEESKLMENSMQLTFMNKGLTKHMFVKHDAPDGLIDWYMGIRHAKFYALMAAYPTSRYDEMLPYLTNDFPMEGWISKTGPGEHDAFRKRWLSLDDRKLMYHGSPLDEEPKGEIFLGHRSEKFDVKEGAAIAGKVAGFVFSLQTPDRTFNFSVATTAERLAWMEVIGKILDTPLSRRDIQCRSSMKSRRRGRPVTN